MKSFFQNFGLLMVSILGCLLLAEVGLRLLGKVPELGQVERGRYRLSANELIGYEPLPGYHPNPESPWYNQSYGMESNALGYRDRDHAKSKRDGSVRILVIGDSIAMGYGIAKFEQTFPHVLEDRLHHRGLDAEVINLGIAGFNTQQEVELLKAYGLEYQPDIVVLQYCMNDHQRIDGDIMQSLLEAQSRDGIVHQKRLHSALAWSALYRTIYARFFHEAENHKALAAVSANTVSRYILELGRLSPEFGFQAVGVIFPLFKDVDTVFRNESAHATIQGVFHQADIPVLDLRDALTACHQETREPIALDYYHPSANAHRCAGEAVAEFVYRVASSLPRDH